MPTREVLPQFWRDRHRLTERQEAFLVAIARFVTDLREGRGFRPGLRVKGFRGAPGTFEPTWAPDASATFSYDRSVIADEPHVVWRRIGATEILRRL